jgi:hypothetical protein
VLAAAVVPSVQSGSILTMTVSTRDINRVDISSLNYGQAVQAEWNVGLSRTSRGSLS